MRGRWRRTASHSAGCSSRKRRIGARNAPQRLRCGQRYFHRLAIAYLDAWCRPPSTGCSLGRMAANEEGSGRERSSEDNLLRSALDGAQLQGGCEVQREEPEPVELSRCPNESTFSAAGRCLLNDDARTTTGLNEKRAKIDTCTVNATQESPIELVRPAGLVGLAALRARRLLVLVYLARRPNNPGKEERQPSEREGERAHRQRTGWRSLRSARMPPRSPSAPSTLRSCEPDRASVEGKNILSRERTQSKRPTRQAEEPGRASRRSPP